MNSKLRNRLIVTFGAGVIIFFLGLIGLIGVSGSEYQPGEKAFNTLITCIEIGGAVLMALGFLLMSIGKRAIND